LDKREVISLIPHIFIKRLETFSINYAGIYKLLPEVIRQMGEIGYACVEHAPFIDGRALEPTISCADLADIHYATRESGCGISGLHWILSHLDKVVPQQNNLSIFAAHSEDEIHTVAYYMRLIDYACALGGTYLVHGSPASRRKPDDLSLEQAMKKAIDFFVTPFHYRQRTQSILNYASKHGIRIGFEPLAPNETNFINTVTEGLILAEKINHPSFGITIDVKAMAAEERPVHKTIASLDGHKDSIVAVHFNDPTLVGPGRAGKESLDFHHVMDSLARIGWREMITVEPFKLPPDEKSYTEDSKKILEYLLKVEKEVYD